MTSSSFKLTKENIEALVRLYEGAAETTSDLEADLAYSDMADRLRDCLLDAEPVIRALEVLQ